MDKFVGTCSICGGVVTIPSAWMGMMPPVPHCRSCGASKKQPHEPIVDMEPFSGEESAKQSLRNLRWDIKSRLSSPRQKFGGTA